LFRALGTQFGSWKIESSLKNLFFVDLVSLN
jgi:hypothetical protein